MREILFKAKRIDNGEWVEGFVARPFSRNAEGNITNYCFNALDEMGFVSECIVSADTICQYTGLTDKNGNKIWENDILMSGEPYIPTSPFFVRFNRKRLVFLGFYDGYKKEFSLSADLLSSCEVIGNIFDNPEFLKEE